MHAIYTMSVTNWGNVFALLKQPSSISATFFLGIFVPPLVETFYLWRLYKLFGTPRACLFGLLVCWTRFCGWILFAVQETRLGYISGELFENWTWLLIVLLVTGAILNGTIAGAMLYYLYGQRDTPLMRTKILVDRLIMWTVQTGLITGNLDGYFSVYYESVFQLPAVVPQCPSFSSPKRLPEKVARSLGSHQF
ncbi:hypothetical protein ONZ45_g11686 [Pleurotus djamor]|nr:hypothetical protein ONZ45_g11686 [Pleurotus djamor]